MGRHRRRRSFRSTQLVECDVATSEWWKDEGTRGAVGEGCEGPRAAPNNMCGLWCSAVGCLLCMEARPCSTMELNQAGTHFERGLRRFATLRRKKPLLYHITSAQPIALPVNRDNYAQPLLATILCCRSRVTGSIPAAMHVCLHMSARPPAEKNSGRAGCFFSSAATGARRCGCRPRSNCRARPAAHECEGGTN